MAKAEKGSVLTRLQSTARLSRTSLASRLLAHGFYAGQEQIMMVLARHENQTPSQLAARLGVRPPTITKTINRLASQGFLTKSPSTEDARQAHITLTGKGLEAIKSIEKSMRKTEKLALKGLDKKDQKTLSKLLSKIESNLSGGIVDAEVDDVVELEEPVAAP